MFTLSPEPGDLNLNRKEKACPNSSEPTPCTDLDAEGVPKPLAILELGSGTGIIIAKLAKLINDQLVSNFSPPSLHPVKLINSPSLGADDILIATDLDNVCPLLEENLSCAVKNFWRINQPSPRILVRPLEWGVREKALKIFKELGSRDLTHIVCSDLVSFPDKFSQRGRIS